MDFKKEMPDKDCLMKMAVIFVVLYVLYRMFVKKEGMSSAGNYATKRAAATKKATEATEATEVLSTNQAKWKKNKAF